MEYGEDLEEVLLPLITCLRDIAVIAVGEVEATKLRQGQGLSPKMFDVSNLIGKEAAVTYDGQLVAIVRIEERKISPVRVFNLNK